MDDIASNVARAITTTLDWSSSSDSRKAALTYLESIKGGEIRALANTSLLLVKKDQLTEIRMQGLKWLQHLVRFRWDEFSTTERGDFASATINLISEMTSPREEWALKSQTAALIAEVVRREGLVLWQELLPTLLSIAQRGPVEAELVAMMLRWLPEDITVHNEDLEGDRRRELLRGLTSSLPDIFPLLYKLLETHFGAALEDVNRQNYDMAKLHAATVIATLNAISAYAEWAPVSDFAKYGLIKGCGFLLRSPEFRLYASGLFKLLSQRRRPIDDTTTLFDSSMSDVFQILINVSLEFLSKSSTNVASIEENEYEYMECICEGMLHLGSFSLECIAGRNDMLSLYLQQMLGQFQHFKLAIHFQSLRFWTVLMREVVSKGKSFLLISNEDQKKALVLLINDDTCGSILDVSFQRMLKKPSLPGMGQAPGTLELWSEEFDGKSEFSQYRSRLLELVKLVASYKPMLAVTRISQQMEQIIKNVSHNSVSSEVFALLESTYLALETIIGAVFTCKTDWESSSAEYKLGIKTALQALLQQLLPLKWTEPSLVETLGHYLDAFGLFLRCYHELLGAVINKLFELLNCLPFVLQDASMSNARHARLQICTSFIRIARAAGKSILPHMQSIAETMGYLEAEGRLLRGERNLLAEAFIVMASCAGQQQQQEVLVWLLEPVSKEWTQLEWQNAYLSDPLGLTRLCSDRQFMWSIYHTVAFFEKAIKRSGARKIYSSPHEPLATVESFSVANPISTHLSWMLPPLVKLLRCVHSLWSQPIIQALPPELRAGMSMSDAEKENLLGGVTRKSKAQICESEMTTGSSESRENDLRNWLKGIRDSGYSVLGLATTIGDSFYRSLDSTDVALALLENIQWMEFRHLRQLVHSTIIPIIRYCPSDLWENWIVNILHPLFVHCQQALPCSWASLMHEGRAKVPDMLGDLCGSDLNIEVMEEQLLRGLTREICQLLTVLALPSLNSGIPLLDPIVVGQLGDISSLKDLSAFASSSLTCFLLLHESLALPALQLSLETYKWTDADAVSRVTAFCGAVVRLSISTNNVQLMQFVGGKMFHAIIQGLTLESNAIFSFELVGLCRDIFVYLSSRDPAPRQVLLSLPGIVSADLTAFEDALTKTSSTRDQRQHMRSLLFSVTGIEFKALSSQRSTNVITNVSGMPRSSAAPPMGASGVGEDETIGLAAIAGT